MTQRTHKDALGRLEVDYAPYELDMMLSALHRKRRRQRAARGAGVAVIAMTLLMLGWWSTRPEPTPTTAPSKLARALQDGSTIERLAPQTRLEVTTQTPTRTQVVLTRGRARFDVSPKASRRFEVQHGPVTVTVLGTSFEVETDEGATQVLVHHGKVRVSGPQGERLLTRGMTTRMAHVPVQKTAKRIEAPRPVAPPEPPERPEVRAPVENELKFAPPRPRKSPAWVASAKRGDYREAAALLTTGTDPRGAHELLLAADAMRAVRDFKQALAYLDAIITRHPRHSSVPVAMFTRGRLWLGPLKRPERAAAEFERVRRHPRAGALVEDALAREVEAWHKAGDQERARSLAREYLRRFPKGTRLGAVRRFGGSP